MTEFSRRGFLAAGAALLTVAAMPRRGAANAPAGLRAATRVIEVDGKAATVFGIEGPAGQGLVLAPGQRFQAQVTNALDVPTLSLPEDAHRRELERAMQPHLLASASCHGVYERRGE